MALKSAVNFDKGIANDNFKRDKKNKSHKWKWMIVAAYGLANVSKHSTDDMSFTFASD